MVHQAFQPSVTTRVRRPFPRVAYLFHETSAGADVPFPQFSVIVPTYNRPEQLLACLSALSAVDAPPEGLEVIVVNDGGTLPPVSATEPFLARLDLKIVSQANAGPAAARNRGAAAARGHYLAFTDDDCLPTSGWLRAIAGRLRHAPDALVAGAQANALPENPYSTATHLVTAYTLRYYERGSAGERFFPACNLVVPATRFRELGGFNEAFVGAAGEDYDFCHRWQARGFPIELVPEAVVYHGHRLELSSFWRQHVGYGRALFHVRLSVARYGGKRFQPQPLRFYLGLLRFPFGQGPALALRHAPLVALSQVATAVGALSEAVLQGRRTRWWRRGSAEERAG